MLNNFYDNKEAIAAFDNRIQHILNFQSSSYPGKRLGDLSNVISSWNVQNEGMGHTLRKYPGWHCARAQHAKKFTNIPISTGGGIDYETSIKEEFYSCPHIDHVGIHTYDVSEWNGREALSRAVGMARQFSKKIVLEEFGATHGKAQAMRPLINFCNNNGIPWMVWQTLKPNNPSDFEFWTDDSEMWGLLKSGAASALNAKSDVAP
jgi:mannan endo-1,4-beta-mannosidase